LKICYQTFLATYPRNFVERQNLFLLFGLALGGVYHAISITRNAVRSYRTISPLPKGGIFSVALSLGSPLLEVIQHLLSIEPGLSSLKSDYSLSDNTKI